MNFFTKLLIVVMAVYALIFIKDTFFEEDKTNSNINTKKIEKSFERKKELSQQNKTTTTKTSNQKPQQTNIVGIYYTDVSNGELKCLHKEVTPGYGKLSFALKELLNGPTAKESKQGYSSEIPKTTKLLELKRAGNSYIINLSDDFQYGGGTESQYLRIKQLIKTVTALKLDKPVYLYLNGKKAEVIGGEGILITQPLSENSLHE